MNLIEKSKKSLTFAIVITIATYIPIVSMLIGMTAFPIFLLHPDFGKTGKFAEFSSLGIFIKSPILLTLFVVYYFIFCLILFFLEDFVKTRLKKNTVE